MGKDQSDILDVPGPGHCSGGSSGSDESVEMQKPPPPQSLYQNQPHHQRNGHLFENLVVLDHILETTPLEQSGLLTGSVEDGMDACSGDELFLLPESVLAMDSVSFREDVRSVAPSLIPKNNNNSSNSQSSNALSNNFGSPHNSLDSTDSAKSLRLLEDSEGLRMARASQGCKTLWLCKWL